MNPVFLFSLFLRLLFLFVTGYEPFPCRWSGTLNVTMAYSYSTRKLSSNRLLEYLRTVSSRLGNLVLSSSLQGFYSSS